MTDHDRPMPELFAGSPAPHWAEAYPVGNGRLGAMVFGGIGRERLALNEDTLWSGAPSDGNNPSALDLLPRVREALFAGDLATADTLTSQMQGAYSQSYQPLGDLILDAGLAADPSGVSGYRRTLDLARGRCHVGYTLGDTRYTRNVFVSHPAQVVVVKLAAEGPAPLRFTVRLTSEHPGGVGSFGSAGLMLRGRAPVHVEPNYRDLPDAVVYRDDAGMRFAACLDVRGDGVRVTTEADHLVVHADDEATLILSAATSFAGYDRDPAGPEVDEVARATATLGQARDRSDDELEVAHVADHAAFFGRVALDLQPSRDDVPTEARIAAYDPDADPGLAALIFHLGRYLLIASSREGSQPANLQGIWNHAVRPPWSSNFTTNINVQMNYWPAESTNLSECARPLFDFMGGLAQRGRLTAQTHYGCGGWCCHHNTDLWRMTHPVGDFGGGDTWWANWNLGGVWLCEALWEHHAFGGDDVFLRETAWPIMREAAVFMLDYLVPVPEGALVPFAVGTPVTAPSTSAENCFGLPPGQPGGAHGGAPVGVDVMCTQDVVLLHELFGRCLETVDRLGLDADAAFTARVRRARDRLPAVPIGADGRLMEYATAWDEREIDHRHLSHLIGLFPGDQITPEGTPGLAAAARRSLEVRTDASTGWSMAWKVNMWARLHDGDRALKLLNQMLSLVPGETPFDNASFAGGVYGNLLDACPPFQIDGNFGATSGIAEMLLQSHDGVIHLLPALPAAWRVGSVRGLRARGGLTVDVAWASGALTQARIVPDQPRNVEIRYAGRRSIVDCSPIAPAVISGRGHPC